MPSPERAASRREAGAGKPGAGARKKRLVRFEPDVVKLTDEQILKEQALADKRWAKKMAEAETQLTDEEILAEQAAKESEEEKKRRAVTEGGELPTVMVGPELEREAAEAPTPREIAVLRVDREFEQKLAAAEAEALKRREAFENLVQTVIEGLGADPMTKRMKDALENSEEARKSKEARAALDGLRKEREETRRQALESLPAEEEVTEVTPEMIVEVIESLPEDEQKEAEAALEKNELSPERKAELTAELEEWNKRAGILEEEKNRLQKEWEGLEDALKNVHGIDPEKYGSTRERMKSALKFLFSKKARGALRDYEDAVKRFIAVSERLNDARAVIGRTELALKDPKKYAEWQAADQAAAEALRRTRRQARRAAQFGPRFTPIIPKGR